MTTNHSSARPPRRAQRDTQTPHQKGSGTPPAQARPEKLNPHPESWRVRELNSEEYEALRADIAAQGVLSPLKVTGGHLVLDGRARLRAARELELAKVPILLVAPEDEIEFMARQALARRHLLAWERAEIVLALAERDPQHLVPPRAGSGEVATLPPSEKTRERYARIGGVAPRTIHNVDVVRKEAPELLEQVRAGEMKFRLAVRRAQQARRRREAGETPPFPEEEFAVVLADPPWQSKNSDSDWAPENHYPTMPLDDILEMGAELRMADDSACFLWAVNALLPEALEVMAAWGFKYRTNLTWVKPSIGLGTWTRCRHELLLYGTRGTIGPPEPKRRPDSVIEAKRGRHSEKPESAYELIERAYPDLPRLELFARGTPRAGWMAWGNEVEQ